MIDQGWSVWSVCNNCFLVMSADLDWFAYRLGEAETLWNRQPQCRRLGCEGLITFHGTPPETNHCMVLKAPWPPEWSASNPPPKARVPEEKRVAPSPNAKAPSPAGRPR